MQSNGYLSGPKISDGTEWPGFCMAACLRRHDYCMTMLHINQGYDYMTHPRVCRSELDGQQLETSED